MLLDASEIGEGGRAVAYRLVFGKRGSAPSVECNTAIDSKDLLIRIKRNPNQSRGEGAALVSESRFGQTFLYETEEFTVSQYIEGITLQDFLSTTDTRIEQGFVKNEHEEEGLRSLLAVRSLQALLTLSYRQYVHRDLKPSNLVIDKKGRVNLIDGELCINEDGSYSDGIGFGTRYFVAPEQSHGSITRKSDVFQMGSTLLMLITGDSTPMMQQIEELIEKSNPEEKVKEWQKNPDDKTISAFLDNSLGSKTPWRNPLGAMLKVYPVQRCTTKVALKSARDTYLGWLKKDLLMDGVTDKNTPASEYKNRIKMRHLELSKTLGSFAGRAEKKKEGVFQFVFPWDETR